MAKIGIFEWIGTNIDGLLQNYIAVTSSDVISQFIGLLIAFGTLYFLMLGYMIMGGYVKQSAEQVLKTAVKFAFISGLALTPAMYMSHVVPAIQGLESGIAATFSGADQSNSKNLYQVLDATFKTGYDLALQLFTQAGKRNLTEIGPMFFDYFIGAIIYASTMLIALPAGAMIMAAKVMLSIMLGIGPIFIAMLMFGNTTTKFFSAWFSQVMTYILQIALVTAVLGFGMRMFSAIVADSNLVNISNNPDSNDLSTPSMLLTVAFVLFYLIGKAYKLGGFLGGGLSLESISLRQTTSPAYNAINGKSTRRDLQSGQMVTAGRLNHLAAGNTLANPHYARHVTNRLFGKNSNWRSQNQNTASKK